MGANIITIAFDISSKGYNRDAFAGLSDQPSDQFRQLFYFTNFYYIKNTENKYKLYEKY